MVNNMKRMFYLSYVYDINGYDRLNLENNPSLKELDEIVSEFNNANEVRNAYLREYNISKKGRICIVFEDLDEKKKQLDEYNKAPEWAKESIKNGFSYAHIIPIMYNDKKLLDFPSCLNILKSKLHKWEIQKTILFDAKTNKGLAFKRNKKYIFETEEELDYIDNLADYKMAFDLFLKRITKESPEDQYFYCRALMHICKLTLTTVKTRFGRIVVYDDNIAKRKKLLTTTEILEEEAKNMDDFYTYHDLDEVIKYSPNKNRPIGSEGKKRK